MRFAGKFAVAGAVGVFAAAAHGEDGWRRPHSAPPVTVRAVAPADDPGPSTAPQWRSSTASDTHWQPVRRSPMASPPPRVEPPPVVLAVQAPSPPPLPVTLPMTVPQANPDEQPEPAPPPRAVTPMPTPPPMPTPQSLPTPRPIPGSARDVPLPTAPSPSTPTAVTPAAATNVWGGYVPCDTAQLPAGGVPVRHGTYGSPDLRLSRDYHALDAFVRPFTGETEAILLGDDPTLANRFFVQTEYLLWWVRQGTIPPLATTADNQLFGFLGQPGTVLLLGPGRFGSQRRDGFRVRAGGWLNDAGTLGIDGSYFFLGSRTDRRSFGSDQFPTILRPIFAPNQFVDPTGQIVLPGEFGELVAFPGLATGTFDLALRSRLWGADVNLTKALICGCDRRLAGFVGYRHLNLRETLTMREFIIAGPDAPNPVGTRILVEDQFDVRNQFHGGQLGLAGERRWGRVSLDGRASVAFGVTHQILNISGFQVVTPPGGPTETFTGGLLAAGPNLGRFTRDRFSVVPEVTLNLGYFLTPNLRAYVGYNFLFWSNVIRPGDQIDRVVDLTFVPNAPRVPFSGENRPLPTFRQTDFWAQGIQFGAEFRW